MATPALEVTGLKDLQRSFRRISKDLDKALKVELAAVAEPVRIAATGLAMSEIPNMTDRWSQMRIGMSRYVVYMVPKAHKLRRRGGQESRPNLSTLLLDRAMTPALDDNTEAISAGMERMLDRLTEWE